MEGIRQDVVTAWLQERVEGFRLPVEFSLIAGGHSNLTYRCTDQAGTTVVLRRPPLGHVLESAHDMGREYKIIHALQGSDVPVAPTLGLCTEVDVNDAPFYVMQFIEGPVLHDAETARSVPEAERHTLGLHVIDILASLHSIEPDDVGLGDLGRREA
ncbi:MAG: phosphotransferase family protein, partial [Gammaproteobacteria bacterium]|nr:phosphotransferase family protein [Gammaproteobacteria bacterium]